MRRGHYSLEFRDLLVDEEEDYQTPLMELTEEEKYDQELKKTSLIKVASVTETNSVFVDLVISKFTKLILK